MTTYTITESLRKRLMEIADMNADHESFALLNAAPSNLVNGLTEAETDESMSVRGLSQKAVPSTSPENSDAEENVRLDAELQRCMKERDVLRTELAALRAAPSYELPFIPWSKEAEMRKSWAAPSTGPDLSRLEPFVSGLGKAILRELQRAAPSTSPEPIYQYQLANGNWIDQSKEIYDHLIKRGGATVRAVYLSAPSTGTADALDAARYRWLRSTTNFVSNKDGERIDVRSFPLAWDEAIDAAIVKGGA